MIHIVPENDSKPHMIDTSCECDYTVDWNQPTALVCHSAFDGRDPEDTLAGGWGIYYDDEVPIDA